jgi:3-methylcrotonyl-CoA carboxylase alpha subunit
VAELRSDVGYDFTLEDRDARVLPRRVGAGLELEIEGQVVRAALEPGAADGEFVLEIDGRREHLFLASRGDVHFLHFRGRTHQVEAWNALDRARAMGKRAGGAEEIRAPMPGVVVAVSVRPGDEVATGTLLLTIESMKLQTAISAGHPGRVAEVCVAVGENFDQGAPLVRLTPLEASPPDDGKTEPGTRGRAQTAPRKRRKK